MKMSGTTTLVDPALVRRRWDRGYTENQWQADVVRLAEQLRWTAYHQYDARRSAPGWPDLVLLKPPQALFLELKTDHGRLAPARQRTVGLLAACGLTARVLRPRDHQQLVALLQRAWGSTRRQRVSSRVVSATRRVESA